ncbi:MAG: hypothetical protein WCF19_03455 [Chlamydiales bacterium]
MPFSLSSIFGRKPQEAPISDEGQPTTTSASEPSAPTLAASFEKESRSFEWNTSRLYHSAEGESQTKTWLVRILSTLLVFPVVLTLLLDLGRYAAFKAGFADGKSFSLIDKASAGVQALATKVSSVFKSTPVAMTKEAFNQKIAKAIKGYAKNLVDGYRALNGGYLHTNDSFSSPYALGAEKQIRQAQKALLAEVNAYVAQNATGTSDYLQHAKVAEAMVQAYISKAAEDDLYISNKVERTGPPEFIRDVALREFLKTGASEGTSAYIPGHAEHFIRIAKQESDFAAGLASGVKDKILTPDQAKQAVQQHAHEVYKTGLETGIVEARTKTKDLLNAGIRENLVTESEAVAVADSIRPDVELLATAAAKDIAKGETSKATDVQIEQQLAKIADQLISEKRLHPSEESAFLTSAKAQIASVKQESTEKALKEKEETEELEAQKLLQVQKAADQTALENKFLGILDVIAKKQARQEASFAEYDQAAKELNGVAEQLKALETKQVRINEKQVSIMQAAAAYLIASNAITDHSKLNPLQKEEQLKNLESQGFTEKTIKDIELFQTLAPERTAIIKKMAEIARTVDGQHEEIVKLIGVYRVYKKNNLGALEDDKRESISLTEKQILDKQKNLKTKHDDLMKVGGLASRFRSDIPAANKNPDQNRQEVEAIIESALVEPGETAPAQPSLPRRLYNYVWGIKA